MSDSPFLTVAEVAKRWRASDDEVKRLALAGEIPGAIIRPGLVRMRILIPIATVEQLESEDWLAAKEKQTRKRRPTRPPGKPLRHFADVAAELD